MLKSLVYRYAPHVVVNALRHYKHLHDLASVHEPEFDKIANFIHAGDTVLDVGANFGVFTKFFSGLVGATGTVFAFEPMPVTFHTLRKGIRRYRLTNVVAMNCAVSDKETMLIMQVPQFAEGGDNLYEAEITNNPKPNLPTFPVHAVSLDSLRLSRVDFIKIDAEWHEIEVLNGARETLARFHPVVLIEIDHPEVYSLLGLLGYVHVPLDIPNKLFVCK